jgi:hypothetical protein
MIHYTGQEFLVLQFCSSPLYTIYVFREIQLSGFARNKICEQKSPVEHKLICENCQKTIEPGARLPKVLTQRTQSFLFSAL